MLTDRHGSCQSDGAASGWSKVGKTLQDIDEEKIRYCKEDIDTLLTFVRITLFFWNMAFSCVKFSRRVSFLPLLLLFSWNPTPNSQRIPRCPSYNC